jgi:CBS domain-containing protein
MILKAKGSEVVTVNPGTTMIDALQIMAEKNIGAMIVLDHSKPVGIFSERDFVREIAREQCLMLKLPVESCMTKELYCVTPSSTSDECMAIMTNKHIRHLPVMQGDELVGIISIGDIVKNMIEDKDLLIDNLQNYIFGPSFGR